MNAGDLKYYSGLVVASAIIMIGSSFYIHNHKESLKKNIDIAYYNIADKCADINKDNVVELFEKKRYMDKLIDDQNLYFRPGESLPRYKTNKEIMPRKDYYNLLVNHYEMCSVKSNY